MLLLSCDDVNVDLVPSSKPFIAQKANNEIVRFKEHHQPLQNLCENNFPKLPNQRLRRNYFIDDKWKKKIVMNTTVISTVADSLLVTKDIASNNQAVVSFSCKGVYSSAKAEITLMAIATASGQAFLFDVLTCPQIMTLGGLKALLENDRVVKVMHECCYESVNLYKQFQTLLKSVFDTQCAKAILQYQNDGTRVNKTRSVSFSKLITLYYAPLNPLEEQLIRYSTHLWRRRPLTREMMIHAARDALVLDEKLYGSMAL